MSYQTEEISEAVNAANEALYYLGIADEKLQSARGWGIADLLGGKMITTMIKRSRMREAEDAMRNAKQALDVLTEELQDIRGYEELDLTLGSYLGISDFLFDNAIVDAMAQARISRAAQDVRNIMSEVEGILDALSDIAAEAERSGE
ncbi:MAG: hypothetical protein K6A40_04785 [Solobacterium sp.]|nr:hypothetical protein [Solobacterium sp.]